MSRAHAFLIMVALCSGCSSMPRRETRAPGSIPVDAVSLSEAEQKFLILLNAYRKQNGVSPVSPDAALQSAAQEHSQYMSKVREVTHEETGRLTEFSDRIKLAGGKFRKMGENVSCYPDVNSLFESWSESDEHRENMLNPDFQFTGISMQGSGNEINQNGCTYDIYWTNTFGGN